MNTVNYTIIPTLTQYSEPERDAELELKWNQVKTAVDNGSWNAMYAKDGAEFDSIVAKMKTDLDAYGYQDAWIGAANRPRSSSPCSKQPPLPCRRLTQRRSRAAFTVTLKMAKDREKSSVTRAFWTAYVQNLKHGVPLSPILLAGIYATWRRCFDKLEGNPLGSPHHFNMPSPGGGPRRGPAQLFPPADLVHRGGDVLPRPAGSQQRA